MAARATYGWQPRARPHPPLQDSKDARIAMKSMHIMAFMLVPVVSGAALKAEGGCCDCPSAEHCVSAATGHYCENSEGSTPMSGCGSYDPFSIACCMTDAVDKRDTNSAPGSGAAPKVESNDNKRKIKVDDISLKAKGDSANISHPSVGCCTCPSGEHCVSATTGKYCENSEGSTPMSGCGSYDPLSLACCM